MKRFWDMVKGELTSRKFWVTVFYQFALYYMSGRLHGSFDSWAMWALGGGTVYAIGLQHDKILDNKQNIQQGGIR